MMEFCGTVGIKRTIVLKPLSTVFQSPDTIEHLVHRIPTISLVGMQWIVPRLGQGWSQGRGWVGISKRPVCESSDKEKRGKELPVRQ